MSSYNNEMFARFACHTPVTAFTSCTIKLSQRFCQQCQVFHFQSLTFFPVTLSTSLLKDVAKLDLAGKDVR